MKSNPGVYDSFRTNEKLYMNSCLIPDRSNGRKAACSIKHEDQPMSDDASVKHGSQTISLADEDAVKQVLVSAVFGLWDIVNNLTRLRPTKRERYRVTIFGSARAK